MWRSGKKSLWVRRCQAPATSAAGVPVYSSANAPGPRTALQWPAPRPRPLTQAAPSGRRSGGSRRAAAGRSGRGAQRRRGWCRSSRTEGCPVSGWAGGRTWWVGTSWRRIQAAMQSIAWPRLWKRFCQKVPQHATCLQCLQLEGAPPPPVARHQLPYSLVPAPRHERKQGSSRDATLPPHVGWACRVAKAPGLVGPAARQSWAPWLPHTRAPSGSRTHAGAGRRAC